MRSGNISKIEKASALVIIIAIALIYIFSIYSKKRLKRDLTTRIAEIESVFVTSKNSNVLVRYTFELNGKRVSGTSNTGCSDYEHYGFLKEFLTGKVATVVLEKINAGNSEMLFSTKDYERFKLEVPDNQTPVVRIIDSLLQNK